MYRRASQFYLSFPCNLQTQKPPPSRLQPLRKGVDTPQHRPNVLCRYGHITRSKNPKVFGGYREWITQLRAREREPTGVRSGVSAIFNVKAGSRWRTALLSHRAPVTIWANLFVANGFRATKLDDLYGLRGISLAPGLSLNVFSSSVATFNRVRA